MSVRLVELGVIVVLHPSEIDDVANMIAKLRFGAFSVRQSLDHLFCNIILEFAVLNAPRIADDMKN
jgi:hypothetical protein